MRKDMAKTIKSKAVIPVKRQELLKGGKARHLNNTRRLEANFAYGTFALDSTPALHQPHIFSKIEKRSDVKALEEF